MTSWSPRRCRWARRRRRFSGGRGAQFDCAFHGAGSANNAAWAYGIPLILHAAGVHTDGGDPVQNGRVDSAARELLPPPPAARPIADRMIVLPATRSASATTTS